MTARLHLDWIDYAEGLLGGGAIDWSSPAAVSGLINKAQALLPSDLVILPVDRMVLAMADPVGLAAKPRGAQPLRTLLADEANRARLIDTLSMIAVPALALGLPAPGAFAGLAARLAGLPSPTVDEDLVDDAAVYLADFLRVFANSTIAGIFVAESEAESALRSFYAPLEKVAASYGWMFAIGSPGPDFETVHIQPGSEPEAVLTHVRTLRV